jgi:hypothetical protein
MAKIEVAVWVFDNPLHLVGPSMAKIEVAVWVFDNPFYTHNAFRILP